MLKIYLEKVPDAKARNGLDLPLAWPIDQSDAQIRLIRR